MKFHCSEDISLNVTLKLLQNLFYRILQKRHYKNWNPIFRTQYISPFYTHLENYIRVTTAIEHSVTRVRVKRKDTGKTGNFLIELDYILSGSVSDNCLNFLRYLL